MRWKQIAALAGAMGAGAALAAWRRPDDFLFAGKSVLITGGSRGLGLLMARELADAGAQLAIIARDSAEVDRAARELSERGARVLGLTGDLRDQAVAHRAVAQTVEHFGRIDVVINNAGVIQAGPLAHMTLKDFEDALAIHLWAPLYTTLAAAPFMRRQGGGRIVNIASIGGQVAVPHLAPYSASKFALVGLSDALRAELAADGITVTTVSPGLMRTGSYLNAQFKGNHQAELTWFAIFDSLPLVSMDGRTAARQIIQACRRGDPAIVLSLPARFLIAADTLFPNATGTLMKVAARLLPGPTNAAGDELRSGWESQSPLAPSLLTTLSDAAAARNNETGGRRAVR